MLLLALLAVSLEFGVAGGIASPQDVGPTTPVLQASAGIDFLEHLTLGGALVGVLGAENRVVDYCPFCTGDNSSFRAIAGLLLIRAHTSGNLQGWIGFGAGPGHLISVSDAEMFEDPALHGRGGLALQLAGGGRYFASRNLALGAEFSWTRWNHLFRPAYTYGVSERPAESDLTETAVLLMLSVTWSIGR